MQTPKLKMDPSLTTSYTRERYIQEAYDKNQSLSAKTAKQSIIARLDRYTNKVHSMTPES